MNEPSNYYTSHNRERVIFISNSKEMIGGVYVLDFKNNSRRFMMETMNKNFLPDKLHGLGRAGSAVGLPFIGLPFGSPKNQA